MKVSTTKGTKNSQGHEVNTHNFFVYLVLNFVSVAVKKLDWTEVYFITKDTKNSQRTQR